MFSDVGLLLVSAVHLVKYSKVYTFKTYSIRLCDEKITPMCTF